jgi:hypothetical protein
VTEEKSAEQVDTPHRLKMQTVLGLTEAGLWVPLDTFDYAAKDEGGVAVYQFSAHQIALTITQAATEGQRHFTLYNGACVWLGKFLAFRGAAQG